MSLNIKQSEAVDAVMTEHNLLLLGAAGTGKTFLIKEIVYRLKSLKKTVAVTATTGIACCLHENASTIHRWSGIGDGRHDVSHIQTVIENNVQFADARKRVLNTDVLIVDECSMLSKRFFDSLNEVCKIKNKSLPFGGIQLVFSGDFRQLPPVPNPFYGEEGEFCFQSSLFQKVFPHTITLTEVIRQSEKDLVQAIHEVSFGDVSHETLLYIDSLKRPLPKDTYSDCIKLFSRNDQVDDFNRQSIVEFPGQLYEFKSVNEGDRKYLNRILAPETLWLKIAAPVILLRNLSDKLVNGLRGNIYDITDSGPIVEFPSLNLKMPLEKVRFSVFNPTKNTDVAVRMQYPVKLSFAISIHKLQGMTLDCLEVDCRNIFKPGQLGVALGRARTSKGLRVINFKPQLCVIQQPEVVRNFLTRDSAELLDDKTCCRQKLESSEQGLIPTVPCQSTGLTEHAEEELQDTEHEIPFDLYKDDAEEFDKEFDDIISMIISAESEPVTLPSDLDLDMILSKLKCENVKTIMQENTNQILKEIDHRKYSQFCQREYLKMSSFIEVLNIDPSVPVSAKNQFEFYSKVHSYQTSAEFRMSCLTFFENSKFTEDHLHICFNISNDIRKYLLKKKAELFPVGQRKISQRTLSNASHARVRYVGGYCIAKTRYKYSKKKKSNMYKVDAASQAIYDESRLAVDILDCLKVEEQYIISTTSEPESLLDVSRRQKTNRSLTNIDDNLFHFFQKLTEICLSLLIDENLNKYGENLFTHIRSEIMEKKELFESFSEVVSQNVNKDSDEVKQSLDEEIQKQYISNIYQKLIKLFLTVMVNQFRKDVLESLNIKKKMAHRKQVRVSQPGQSKSGKATDKTKKTNVKELSPTPGTSKDSVMPAKKRKRKIVDVESGSTSSTQEMEDIQMKSTGRPRRKRKKTLNVESSSSEEVEKNEGETVKENVQVEEENLDSDGSKEDEEKCKVCDSSEKYFKGEILWIQCDGCNKWLHRSCAGLQHHMKWKKAMRKGSKFYCNDCN